MFAGLPEVMEVKKDYGKHGYAIPKPSRVFQNHAHKALPTIDRTMCQYWAHATQQLLAALYRFVER